MIFIENGNPGNLPGLYSGSVAEFTKADTVIFRTDLYNSTTMQRIYPFKRTIKYDSKWLDSKFFHSLSPSISLLTSLFALEPNFVGSFDIGDYVYFFFRESAVEYINCGKAIYSRVARVCKVCFILYLYFDQNLYFFFFSEILVVKIYSIKIGHHF